MIHSLSHMFGDEIECEIEFRDDGLFSFFSLSSNFSWDLAVATFFFADIVATA